LGGFALVFGDFACDPGFLNCEGDHAKLRFAAAMRG